MAKDKETPVTETPEVTNKEEGKTPKGGKTFTQEEVNALVAERLERQSEKEAEMRKQIAEEAAAEATRIAQLSAEERERELKAKHEVEIAEREKKVTLREHKSLAIEKLTELGIPIHLADSVVNENADTMNDNIIKLQKSFTEAVESSVAKRLEGTPPKDLANKGGDKKVEIKTVF